MADPQSNAPSSARRSGEPARSGPTATGSPLPAPPAGAPQPPGAAASPSTGFESSLDDLLAALDTLPPEHRSRLLAVATATRRRHQQLRETVSRLQEALDLLRLNLKYLVFDLEATRRENAYLRKLLDEYSGDD